MEILKVCACLIITVLVLVGVGGIAAFVAWMADERDDWPCYAFIFASIGFGVCLTIILLQNEVIY